MPTPKSYQIIDRHTGAVVGQASTLKKAIRSVDKRDNAYGGYRYTWRHTPTSEPIRPDGRHEDGHCELDGND